jgi:hypothetical protein
LESAASIAWAKAELRFRHRDLSGVTINRLIAAGLDAPERLLFMSAAEIGKLKGLDAALRKEIDAYRSRFVGLKRHAATRWRLR